MHIKVLHKSPSLCAVHQSNLYLAREKFQLRNACHPAVWKRAGGILLLVALAKRTFIGYARFPFRVR